ncbi:MAG TPA: SH3 domain-containing protein [Burkholderiales bacterium]|nr:SH3 domain-containing protein [Burkholderiales bacterium]
MPATQCAAEVGFRVPRRAICMLAFALLGATAAHALDYRSVAVPAAVLYDAPSAKGHKLFVLNQGYPVEVLVALDAWLKVRDASGELAWIEAKNLSMQRMVMVKVPKADVRQSPDESAPVLFQAEQDLLLEVIDTADNWARVKHRDGTTGYIRITQVWGL